MDLPEDRVTLIVVSDETQSWMLQETLNRTERLDAIGQLSGGISHELANILGVIRLTSDTAVLRPISAAAFHLCVLARMAADKFVEEGTAYCAKHRAGDIGGEMAPLASD